LTEDVFTTRVIRDLASEARPGQVFTPQCGLAPGFVGILGNSIARRFDRLDILSLRVGALPKFPSNALMYNLTWSTEGLVNEYCNPCEAIKNGSLVELQPLEGYERFTLDGMQLEAFNTSGGLGALCDALQGQVRELSYKTIRYPGHRDIMDVLINTLRLGDSGEQRELLERILETSIAVTDQDVVIVFVTAVGQLDGKLTQISSYYKIEHGWAFGSHWSAIQMSTASALCVVLDLVMNQQVAHEGFLRQEEIPLELFLASPMATVYAESTRRTDDGHATAASI
jgi:saccharopine dehydrogenase-like NADP-dependent oxidoreductase